MNYKDEINELEYICRFLNDNYKFVNIDVRKIKELSYKYTNIKINNEIYTSTVDVEIKLNINSRYVRKYLENRIYKIGNKLITEFVKEYKSGKAIIQICYKFKCNKKYDIDSIKVIF